MTTVGNTALVLSRGFKNNNPGNIEKDDAGKWKAWQGLAKQQNDSRFVVYESAVMGIRALCVTLITYQDKHGKDTIDEIVNRWAPPINNKTKKRENHTENYIKFVSNETGYDRNAELNMHKFEHVRAVALAIMDFENDGDGVPYTEDVIRAGINLAGVPVPAKLDKEVVAGVGTSAGGLLSVLTDQLEIFRSTLEPFINIKYVMYACLTLTIVSGCAMLYFKMLRAARGQA